MTNKKQRIIKEPLTILVSPELKQKILDEGDKEKRKLSPMGEILLEEAIKARNEK